MKERLGRGLSAILLSGSLIACSDQSAQPELRLPQSPAVHIYPSPEVTSTPVYSKITPPVRPTPTFNAPGEFTTMNPLRYRLIDSSVDLDQNPTNLNISVYRLEAGTEANIIMRTDIKKKDQTKKMQVNIITKIGLPDINNAYPYQFILSDQDDSFYAMLQTYDYQKKTYENSNEPLLFKNYSSTLGLRIRIGDNFIQAGKIGSDATTFIDKLNGTFTYQIGGAKYLTLGTIERQNAAMKIYQYDIDGEKDKLIHQKDYIP